MPPVDPSLQPLVQEAFPLLAAAIRERAADILAQWQTAVRTHLPAADELTLSQLRNSVPLILEEIADALASQQPAATTSLIEGSKSHGATRFHDQYNIRELTVEYRLLRSVILEQSTRHINAPLSEHQNIALNIAIDVALQSGVVAFTEHQRRQIEASAETQSKYLSYLSHDLRNHLNHAVLVLELLLQRLQNRPEFAESVEDVRSVQQSIYQTTSGMDRLLQAERLRKQHITPKLKTLPIQNFLLELAAQHAHQAQLKNLVLRVEAPESASIQTDRELLTLILQNLLGNAIKYSTRGQITLLAQLFPSPDPSHPPACSISITDQGPGISPENLTRLFQAFSRGNTHGQEGFGLGLSIASQAAKLLNAKLEVESTLHQGSTFRLLLPT